MYVSTHLVLVIISVHIFQLVTIALDLVRYCVKNRKKGESAFSGHIFQLIPLRWTLSDTVHEKKST